ncbi:MAG: hypothetical protein Ct9H300mP20_04370 [Gammaproteobacteria bacterium]|nr:MAG: hypothetical protein Ct9H300mP20_04370 [Gammaproteobacteria bacterium]
METSTIFIVGHYNEIARGALLLVSDVPVTPDGVKTEESDKGVTEEWSDLHLEIGINAMTEIGKKRRANQTLQVLKRLNTSLHLLLA